MMKERCRELRSSSSVLRAEEDVLGVVPTALVCGLMVSGSWWKVSGDSMVVGVCELVR